MSLPPSSPRLPSPPPPAENQVGPKSPLMGPNAARQAAQIEQTALDTNAKRRIHPGTKSADMAAGPPLVPLHELDSAFQLQEHLAALHYHHTSSHTSPVSRETAKLLATPPPGIDKTLWLYELCRFLIAQYNSMIVGFLFDSPPCSAATCPEMRASEWQFLCAVHESPKYCCAIDYCCHTLDWATNVVTNPKIFPSRFVVDAHDKNTALKSLVNVFRRLHRIFAHAWFQHRGVFWAVESQTGLYVFFKTVCDVYDLLPAENYKLPPEAEGLDSNSTPAGQGDSTDRRQQQQQQIPPVSIAKPPSQRAAPDDENYSSVSRTNTRRHIKSSPSTGSAITTVSEAEEDDDAHLSNRLGRMRLSNPAAAAAADDELELASIPVMVEHRPPPPAEQPLRPSSVIPPPGMAASEPQRDTKPELELGPAKQEPEAETEAAAPEPDQATGQESPPEPPVEDDFAPEPEAMPEPQPEPRPEPENAPLAAPDEEQQAPADAPAAAKEPETPETATEKDQGAASDMGTLHEVSGADNGSPSSPSDSAAAEVTAAAETEADAKSAEESDKVGDTSSEPAVAVAVEEEKDASQSPALAVQAATGQGEEDQAKEEKSTAKTDVDAEDGAASSEKTADAVADGEKKEDVATPAKEQADSGKGGKEEQG